MSQYTGQQAGAPREPSLRMRERIEVPGAFVEQIDRPARTAELSELLAEHHAKSEGVLVCGGRTRLELANRARPLAAAVSLDALAGIDVFEPDEGVVHALSGTPIRVLQAAVAAEGWELPLDPPGSATTVGGTISSASMGPRSHAFGRVADAVLGLELVGADGDVSKCGGRVVKNVTGYDLAKLYTGSFGSLAVVTGAWLRLRPQPARRLVLAGPVAQDRETFERARALSRAVNVRAFVWSESAEGSEAQIAVELGASEAGVAHDRKPFEELLGLREGEPVAIDRLRDARSRAECRAPLALRARVLATRLEEMRRAMLAAGLSVSIDVGLGVVSASGALAEPQALMRLRETAESCGGHASFEWLPTGWYKSLDVFGEQPGTRDLAAALKQRFDPRQILNPGRFVAGT